MPGSSISTESLRGSAGGDPGRGPSRSRRTALWLAGGVGLARVAVIAAALIPGSHASAPPFSTLAVAPRESTANQLHTRVTAVFGSSISAQRYGTQISQRE